MLDSDLAELYQVSTSRLNEQVKRNIERFPSDFMFQLTQEEWNNLISQFATSSWGGRRKLPYVFTEHGVAGLSGVLRSEIATQVHIEIMRAFVNMRKYIATNGIVFQRLDRVEQKQLEADHKFDQVFKALESQNQLSLPVQGVFFNGQTFDAYQFVSDLVRSAKTNIILIDNYIDDTVITLLKKKSPRVSCHIFTKTIDAQLQLDVRRFNEQYGRHRNGSLEIHRFTKAHDRFLIIDEAEVYHFGASLKDLGKKWFAFSKMDRTTVHELLEAVARLAG